MKRVKILVIDDEKALCFLIRNILEEAGGYEVIEANEGREGLRLCLQERPRLIFLDYLMPGIKGDELIASLRSDDRTRHIPIVLMSGLGEMIFFDKIELYNWLSEEAGGYKDEDGKLGINWDKLPEYVARKMNVDYYLSKPFVSQTLLQVTENLIKGEKLVKK